ncbi:glycosyltransferase [Vibrio parahaemolyticus]|uniref:glycosyltransferase n=1 Tax=Vibrio parahaemolyticus TaxID=670 RepID=UPI001E50D53C|nr:glycosyltransferase [Vibrio parahaemolyticus]
MKDTILLVEPGSFLAVENGDIVRGGSISTHKTALAMSKVYDVHILTSHKRYKFGVFKIKGITIHNIRTVSYPKSGFLFILLLKFLFSIELNKLLKVLKPKLIISQANLLGPSVRCAEKYDIKSAVWIRAFENFYDRNLTQNTSFIRKVNFFLKSILFKFSDKKAIRKADLVLTNSIFMQRLIESRFQKKSTVIYPAVDSRCKLKEHSPSTNKKNIVIMNPTKDKGLYVILKIAEKLKNINFYYYGKKPDNCLSLETLYPNVQFKGWESNLEIIFKNAKLLLVPSMWEEPFGRVSVEATSHNVIPIVSKVGGLPETVSFDSRLIIDNVEDIDEWCKKIERLLSNLGEYESIMNSLSEHVAVYNIDRQGEALLEEVGKIIR